MKTINVRDVGASGDGRTDDTAKFMNSLKLLTIAGGGELVIPPGIYLLSKPVSINYIPLSIRGCVRDLSVLR